MAPEVDGTRRRLAAVLAADVVDYTIHTSRDEAGTLERVRTLRQSARSGCEQHDGRVVDAVGDNFMAEFASVVNATRFATEFQRALDVGSEGDADALRLRIGIHVGDVLIDDEDRLYGDAVNVAARVMGLGEPGTISITSTAQTHLASRHEISTRFLGEYQVKNVELPVGVHRVELDPGEKAESRSPVEAQFGRPAVAVLPFDNMSSDPDQEFLAEGLVEDLTTALASSSWLTVIARNSAFAYKGRTFNVTDVSEELGARYVVEGSVRRAGDRVRVTAQLIDGPSGHHIWAERYDRKLDDLFALQDELTEAIAAVLEPSVERAERSRVLKQPGRDVDAWASLHRGRSLLGTGAPASSYEEARQWFQRAAELAPNWGLPHGMEALALVLAITFDRVDDVVDALRTGLECAQRGAELSPNDAEVQNGLGWITCFARQYDRSEKAFRRGISLNSSMAGSYHGLGYTLSMNDQPEEAIPLLERSILLSPKDVQMQYRRGHLGQAHFQLGRYEDAIENVLAALELKDQYGFTYLAAAIQGMAGNVREGRALMDRVRARFPDSSFEALRVFLSPGLFDLHVEGLTRLGKDYAPEQSA